MLEIKSRVLNSHRQENERYSKRNEAGIYPLFVLSVQHAQRDDVMNGYYEYPSPPQGKVHL